jgi:chemotaxis receptor (MCP) glutamine deamidase CheD
MPTKFRIKNGWNNFHEKGIHIGWPTSRVESNGRTLKTSTVNSCLAITLYDPITKKGALAHIKNTQNPMKLKPKRVISTLLEKIDGSSTLDYKRLEASLSGEGALPKGRTRISPIVRKTIQDYGINIIGEDLKKGHTRAVSLDCSTGKVKVYRY